MTTNAGLGGVQEPRTGAGGSEGLRDALRALTARWERERAEYPVDTDEGAKFAATAMKLATSELRALLDQFDQEPKP